MNNTVYASKNFQLQNTHLNIHVHKSSFCLLIFSSFTKTSFNICRIYSIALLTLTLINACFECVQKIPNHYIFNFITFTRIHKEQVDPHFSCLKYWGGGGYIDCNRQEICLWLVNMPLSYVCTNGILWNH